VPSRKNDRFFLLAGAEAFKPDIPAAVARSFDTGYFALENTVPRDRGSDPCVFLGRAE